jgi:hypothetical protein
MSVLKPFYNIGLPSWGNSSDCHRKEMLKKANFQFSSHLNVVVEPPHYPVVMVAMLEIVFGGEW